MFRTLAICILALIVSFAAQALPAAAKETAFTAAPPPYLGRAPITYSLTDAEILACMKEALVLNPHIKDPRRIQLLKTPIEVAIPCGPGGSIARFAFTAKGQTIWGFAERALHERKYSEAVARRSERFQHAEATVPSRAMKPAMVPVPAAIHEEPTRPPVPWKGLAAALLLLLAVAVAILVDIETRLFAEAYERLARGIRYLKGAYDPRPHRPLRRPRLHSFTVPIPISPETARRRRRRRLIGDPAMFPLELPEGKDAPGYIASPEWRQRREAEEAQYEERERRIAEYARQLHDDVDRDMKRIFNPP